MQAPEKGLIFQSDSRQAMHCRALGSMIDADHPWIPHSIIARLPRSTASPWGEKTRGLVLHSVALFSIFFRVQRWPPPQSSPTLEAPGFVDTADRHVGPYQIRRAHLEENSRRAFPEGSGSG